MFLARAKKSYVSILVFLKIAFFRIFASQKAIDGNRVSPLIDLMLISVYGDEHEFDYKIVGEYVAENIWHYKKP